MGAIKNVAAGKSTGLYHLIFGEGQNAFVANGKRTLVVESISQANHNRFGRDVIIERQCLSRSRQADTSPK